MFRERMKSNCSFKGLASFFVIGLMIGSFLSIGFVNNHELDDGSQVVEPITSDGPDQEYEFTDLDVLAEDTYFSGLPNGRLSGHWGRYGGSGGYTVKDTEMVLSGDASIRVVNGYGFQYYFDTPEDLSGYTSLKFWLRAADEGTQLHGIWFYSGSNGIYQTIKVRPGHYPQGYKWDEGWWGVNVNLDFETVGTGSSSSFNIETVTKFSIYFVGNNGWIDGVYFSDDEWSDDITESLNPSGPWSGQWIRTAGESEPVLSTHDAIGDYSIDFYWPRRGCFNPSYRWDNPIDLSVYNGFSTVNWWTSGYPLYLYIIWIYDENGARARMDIFPDPWSGTYFGSQNNWYVVNIGFDQGFYTYYGEFDWTKVKMITFELGSSSSGHVYIDGLEFFSSKKRVLLPPEPDKMSEGIVYEGLEDGRFAGHWDTPFGHSLHADTSQKLEGEKSIVADDLYQNYGFSYVFDNPEDLSGYKSFTCWIKTESNHASMYGFYLRSGSGYARSYYMMGPDHDNTPWYTVNDYGWWGLTFSLDVTNINPTVISSDFDMGSVTDFTIMFVTEYKWSWLDCAYFSLDDYGDAMTESASPVGEWGGNWDGFSTSIISYVGDYSVSKMINQREDFINYYTWDQPVDLSGFNALRFFTKNSENIHSFITDLILIDAWGNYAHLDLNRMFLTFTGSDSHLWYLCNIGFDKNFFYDSGIDWTRIRYMVMTVEFTDPCQFYIDGFEFYSSSSSGNQNEPPPYRIIVDHAPILIYDEDEPYFPNYPYDNIQDQPQKSELYYHIVDYGSYWVFIYTTMYIKNVFQDDPSTPEEENLFYHFRDTEGVWKWVDKDTHEVFRTMTSWHKEDRIYEGDVKRFRVERGSHAIQSMDDPLIELTFMTPLGPITIPIPYWTSVGPVLIPDDDCDVSDLTDNPYQYDLANLNTVPQYDDGTDPWHLNLGERTLFPLLQERWTDPEGYYQSLDLDEDEYYFINLWNSPELYVMDSEGRVTGLIDGEVVHEIPGLVRYLPEYETIIIMEDLDLEIYAMGDEDELYDIQIHKVSFMPDGEVMTWTFAGSNLQAYDGLFTEFDISEIEDEQITIHQEQPDGSFKETTTDLTASAPIAEAGDDVILIVDEEHTFDGTGSYDDDGSIVMYSWDFDDGSVPDLDSEPTHSFSSTGTYDVTLTVIDDEGLSGQDSLTVAVITPSEAIDLLIEFKESLDLSSGIENSLDSKLDNAKKSLAKGNDKAASNQLEAFINEVEAQAGKKISESDAVELIEYAQWIITNI